MDVGLALILCFLMVSMTAVKSQILEGPVNALKKVGDNVTLKCVTVNKNCDKVDWQKVEGLQSPKLVYRNGQGMLNNDFYPPQRYSVNESYGCSLTITQLEINDSGRFICMQAVDSGEETRTSILVVISVVTESCVSKGSALDKDDGDGLWCAINIPAKSVEPWNVTLSFHNKAVGEKETTDENQLLTVNTTLTGIATKEHSTQRGCRASFTPNTQSNYDNNNATLDVCGPKFGDTVKFMSNNGDKYSNEATNKVNGGAAPQRILREVSSPPAPGPGGIAGIAAATMAAGTAIGVVSSVAWRRFKKKNGIDYPVANIFISVSPLGPEKGYLVRCTADGHPPPTFKWTHLESGKVIDGDTLVIKGDVGDKYTCTATNTVNGKETSQNITIEFTSPPPEDENGGKGDGPLTYSTSSEKLPPNRPRSECKYTALEPEPNPRQKKPNPARNSSSVYASVSIA